MSAADAPELPSLEHELLSVADEAARAAAAELMSRFGHRQAEIRSKSSPTDLVSEADVAAETAIRAVLATRRPQDAILGEEGGATGGGELRWVIDPLDGTTNFLFGFPQFAVSVACEDGAGGLVGVVLDPRARRVLLGDALERRDAERRRDRLLAAAGPGDGAGRDRVLLRRR